MDSASLLFGDYMNTKQFYELDYPITKSILGLEFYDGTKYEFIVTDRPSVREGNLFNLEFPYSVIQCYDNINNRFNLGKTEFRFYLQDKTVVFSTKQIKQIVFTDLGNEFIKYLILFDEVPKKGFFTKIFGDTKLITKTVKLIDDVYDEVIVRD